MSERELKTISGDYSTCSTCSNTCSTYSTYYTCSTYSTYSTCLSPGSGCCWSKEAGRWREIEEISSDKIKKGKQFLITAGGAIARYV